MAKHGRRFWLLLGALPVLLAGCAAGGPASVRQERPSQEQLSDEDSIAMLWDSIRADLAQGGRASAVEQRAQALVALQNERCRKIRAELLRGPQQIGATQQLATCEAELSQYQTMARISDYGSPRRGSPR